MRISKRIVTVSYYLSQSHFYIDHMQQLKTAKLFTQLDWSGFNTDNSIPKIDFC